MELKTWKRLLSASLMCGLLGFYLLLFNLVLSIFFMSVCGIGLMLLAWKRWKIILGRYSWLHLGALKRVGELPEDLEQEKMPSWLFAWIILAPFVLIPTLFLLESEFWYISLFLFYAWITSAFLIVLYIHVIKH